MPYAPADVFPTQNQICRLPLDHLSPRPACCFSQDEKSTLEELMQSIRDNGLMRPITVQRSRDGHYAVVSGNRRLMACRMLGMTHIDALLLWPDPHSVSAHQLLQSLITGRLHYLEQARALHALHTHFGMSREQLARRLDMSAAAVASSISLCGLEIDLQVFLMEENISERIALALLQLPDAAVRMYIARQAASEHLSVREAEALISSAQTRLPASLGAGGRTIRRMRDHRLYLNALRSIITQMQEAGVETRLSERQVAERIELTISISTRRRRCRE